MPRSLYSSAARQRRVARRSASQFVLGLCLTGGSLTSFLPTLAGAAPTTPPPTGNHQLSAAGAVYALRPDHHPLLRTAQAPPPVTIKGRVLDELGKPIPGSTVLVKGTSNTGTVTDANGAYTLSVPDGGGILVVSSIGFTTQEVPIDNRAAIDITLKTDVKSLNEVVVVGYGTQRRAEVPCGGISRP